VLKPWTSQGISFSVGTCKMRIPLEVRVVQRVFSAGNSRFFAFPRFARDAFLADMALPV